MWPLNNNLNPEILSCMRRLTVISCVSIRGQQAPCEWVRSGYVGQGELHCWFRSRLVAPPKVRAALCLSGHWSSLRSNWEGFLYLCSWEWNLYSHSVCVWVCVCVCVFERGSHRGITSHIILTYTVLCKIILFSMFCFEVLRLFDLSYRRTLLSKCVSVTFLLV